MKKGALLEVLETILVVTVITALIWLYAEGETISTQTKTITVRFVPPIESLVVSTVENTAARISNNEIKIEATIQASRGNWARVSERLRQSIDIETNDPGQAMSTEQVINLRDTLNQSDLADVNAFIKEVEPATITVRIQRLEEVSMGIRIDKGDLEVSDENPPIAEPGRVNVTMTAELAALVREQKLQLVARLGQPDSNPLSEDTLQNLPVELDLPVELQGQPFVQLSQEQVNVKFQVRKLTEQIDVPGVQVRLLISDDITSRFESILIDEDQRFIKVTVSGPSEAIERIRNDDNLVRASILLKLSDLTNPDNNSAPLEVIVPEGCKVTGKEPNLDTITYKATPRTETP